MQKGRDFLKKKVSITNLLQLNLLYLGDKSYIPHIFFSFRFKENWHSRNKISDISAKKKYVAWNIHILHFCDKQNCQVWMFDFIFKTEVRRHGIHLPQLKAELLKPGLLI